MYAKITKTVISTRIVLWGRLPENTREVLLIGTPNRQLGTSYYDTVGIYLGNMLAIDEVRLMDSDKIAGQLLFEFR